MRILFSAAGAAMRIRASLNMASTLPDGAPQSPQSSGSEDVVLTQHGHASPPRSHSPQLRRSNSRQQVALEVGASPLVSPRGYMAEGEPLGSLDSLSATKSYSFGATPSKPRGGFSWSATPSKTRFLPPHTLARIASGRWRRGFRLPRREREVLCHRHTALRRAAPSLTQHHARRHLFGSDARPLGSLPRHRRCRRRYLIQA